MRSARCTLWVGLGAALAVLAAPFEAGAHCDTMDGPVVHDARAALDSGDVTTVLKWVEPEAEATIREGFRRTIAVRALGPEARDMADRSFFELLVRIHRQGEGAPYTGIEPPGTEVDPVIATADAALEKGSVEPLSRMLAAQIEKGLRERFGRAAEAKKHAAQSVERGREYVRAYVDFMHYAERLAAGAAGPAEREPPSASDHRH
jgi:hypothetical protein